MPRLFRILVPLALMSASFLVALVVGELFARVVMDRPMTVEVKDHGDEIPVGEQAIETVGFPNDGLYVRTATGLRLKRSSRAVVRDHSVSRTDVTITTNAFGFRYPEVGPKTADEVRVLVLGDSVTFGDSVQDGETFPDRAEQSLGKSPPPGCETTTIRVINGGIGAADLQNEFAVLMDTGLLIEPDVVLVGLYLNDARMSYAIEITNVPPLVEHSYFLSWVFLKIDGLRSRSTLDQTRSLSIDRELEAFLLANPPAFTSWVNDTRGFNSLIENNFIDWGFAWSDEYWRRVEELLRLMRSVARQHGFQLAVAMLPVRYQVQAEILRNEPQQRFDDLMNRLGLPHLDLLPPLRSRYQEDGEDIFFDHCHFKPEGNEIVGEEVAEFVRGIVGCRSAD